MQNKNENEELQSRREFFKKAAKAALPVIGAVVVASLPIEKASGQNYCYCAMNCYGSCSGSCHYTCEGGCKTTCEGQCRGTCIYGNMY
jgi:CXXX repeat radical SAM target protein